MKPAFELAVRPFRTPWGEFPDVIILAGQTQVMKHAEYPQAKAGNVVEAAPAAKRLAAALIPDDLAAAVRLDSENCRIVPVHALEHSGYNRIPAAFAELIAGKLGLGVETGIIQANVVNHTGASGWARLARPAVFDGEVHPGQRYLLVDDFVGQGGTLANLRGYIEHLGGQVAGCITLTGRGDSAKLALSDETLRNLREKHGSEAENWWREAFGYGFGHLTESEARYLLRAEDADTIRERVSQAGSEGDG